MDDLVGRLTIDEMIGQMSNGGNGNLFPLLQRLRRHPQDALRNICLGLVTPPPSLSVSTHLFSLSVALATSYSFNRTLVHKVAEYTADEVRGKHNDYVKRTASSSLSIPLEGIYKVHAGITCWTPVVNIFRHPLWGRGQETYFSSLNL